MCSCVEVLSVGGSDASEASEAHVEDTTGPLHVEMNICQIKILAAEYKA